MSRVLTQKQIGDYLVANQYNVKVAFGDLENMNGDDYIFVDYLNEELIPADNKGCYKTNVQISIYTKDFAKRKSLVEYVKGLSQFRITYQGSDEGNYFVAILQTELFLNA